MTTESNTNPPSDTRLFALAPLSRDAAQILVALATAGAALSMGQTDIAEVEAARARLLAGDGPTPARQEVSRALQAFAERVVCAERVLLT